MADVELLRILDNMISSRWLSQELLTFRVVS
jgi:hypothetical protein